MMELILKSLFYLILILFNSCLILSNHIKGLDDSILFHVNWPGYSESLLDSPDYEMFEMITSNKEKFHCLVPLNYGKISDTSDAYHGPNALKLLMPLLKKENGACTLRLETFWTYELCHGQHIKQYHEEKDGKASRLQEYSLGVTSYSLLEELSKELDDSLRDNPNPIIPVTKIEGVDLPYFAINYTGGTMCDLTGNARFSRVLYVCYEEGHQFIYSIKETYTCEYEVVVLTSVLCQHPAYRPNDVPQTDLHCISEKPEAKRPRNMLQIEAESLKLRTHGAILDSDISGGTIRIGVTDENKVEAGSGQVEPSEPLKTIPPTLKFPLKASSVDKKLVEDFLKGDYCLQGGSGWWKYEFCHGKVVQQYHKVDDGSKMVIVLGIFNAEKHKHWIEEHPSKKFRPGKNKVSHLYSGGDRCDSIGKDRQVEVKLKCKESDSPSSVTLYLLEPRTCEYVLGVETSIVCPLLQNANEYGLFSLEVPQINANENIDSTMDQVEKIQHNGENDIKVIENSDMEEDNKITAEEVEEKILNKTP